MQALWNLVPLNRGGGSRYAAAFWAVVHSFFWTREVFETKTTKCDDG